MNGVTLLKFHADWCVPCKQMAPVIKEVVAEFNVDLKEVNVEEETDIAVQHSIRNIPALVLIKNGVRVNTLVGSKSAEELRKFLANNI